MGTEHHRRTFQANAVVDQSLLEHIRPKRSVASFVRQVISDYVLNRLFVILLQILRQPA